MKNGFFGIGIFEPKTSQNIGSLWRSAYNFGADFLFTIGSRTMHRQASDTVLAYKNIPFYVYPDIERFILPSDCFLVGIEKNSKSQDLAKVSHHERCCYLLGAEDYGLPDKVLEYCTGGIIHIDTPLSINVAVAGSIVMYDRQSKG